MRTHHLLLLGLALACAGCEDEPRVPAAPGAGEANAVFTQAEWYPGGELGTTTNEEGCYGNPAPAIEAQGLDDAFNTGELFFERDMTLATEPFAGLGPLWQRPGCLYCRPNYGKGSRQAAFSPNTRGNSYKLHVFHPAGSTDAAGNRYEADTFVKELTMNPKTAAMDPFKPEIDPGQIRISWLPATDAHGNRFADGERYDLIYPEVEIPLSAFNTNPKPDHFEVRIYSSVGIYGNGLLGAIPEDSIKAQWQREAPFTELNPRMWDKAAGTWAETAYMPTAGGGRAVARYNYAMDNVFVADALSTLNMTDADHHFFDTSDAWAKAMGEDEAVAKAVARSQSPLLKPYKGDGSEADVRRMVEEVLGLNTADDAEAFEGFFGQGAAASERTDLDYYYLAVWLRGIPVPMARDLDKPEVQRGKQLFYGMQCTQCHRPSWNTANDDYPLNAALAAAGLALPRYQDQTIWPYTDMVQHRLFMKNDLMTGWCRTAHLWGRGLMMQETGHADRLHDSRARNVVEAIMWHGYDPRSDAYDQAQRFYNLPKEDRDAVVAFINAI